MKAWKLLRSHMAEILTGCGITGMFCGGIMAVSATPKAMQNIEDEKKKLGKEKLTKLETVRVTWKCYVPAVITSAAGTVCILKGYSITAKRTAALATAWTVTDNAFREYRGKVTEMLGEEKEKEVETEIAKDRVREDIAEECSVVPYRGGEAIVMSSDFDLCYDMAFGRYFWSNTNRIKAAENAINRLLLLDGSASLNDFYDELGIPHTEMGDELGWSANRDGYVDIHIGHWLSEDGRPCIAISYRVAPRLDYSWFN